MQNEKCVDGVCKCGTGESCEGKPEGRFCDAANSECKCSECVSACTNGVECKNGVCCKWEIIVLENNGHFTEVNYIILKYVRPI